ncbi:MAG: hypothetical protein V9F03_12750 [Microthrixaceae bacterium]
MVDFSHREASVDNLVWLAEHGIHAVVGTTGFSDDELDRFRRSVLHSPTV